MAQVKGNKTGKVWHSVISGVDIKKPAYAAAAVMSENTQTQALLRATAAQALLVVGKACAKTGEVASIESAAHFYAEARMAEGMKPGTISKEASQLRAICRACFGGVKVQTKLDEQDTLMTHEFAKFARSVTPKAYLKVYTQKKPRVKSEVTDVEFAKMRQWCRLLSKRQRAILEGIFAKMDAKPEGKVIPLKKAA